MGTTTADSNGNWSLKTNVDLNNTTYFTKDGERDLIATATDAGGDVGATASLTIFVDTAGPQVASVTYTNTGQDVFARALKRAPNGQATAIDIVFTDAATRSGPFSNLPALNNILAHETSNYQLSGQTTGVDPITAVYFTDETQAGGPGTTDIQLTFANPLVDDVHTLSIFDTLMNDAGNKLDGEVTAASGGTDTIVLPSGNGVPGGNFVATFAVQANTELAVAMTQGVQFFNLQTVGMAGTTMTSPFGNPSDILFTGNFANPTTGLADGFSKLAAYGEDNGQFRFLFQSDNGGPTTSVVPPLQIPALPVAGNFDGNASNGAEVGLYTGSDWYLFSHDFSSYEVIPWSHPGLPVVGDFDGDGLPDLATWSDGAFYVALSMRKTITK